MLSNTFVALLWALITLEAIAASYFILYALNQDIKRDLLTRKDSL